jgi:hypothetical protein
MPLARAISDFTATARSSRHEGDFLGPSAVPTTAFCTAFPQQVFIGHLSNTSNLDMNRIRGTAFAVASLLIVSIATAMTRSAATESQVYPAGIENCGVSTTYARAPTRAEIDFAYTTPGIRNVAAVRKLAEALYPERFR